MVIRITKKLADKLNLSPESLESEDMFFSWRANYVQEKGQCFIVFVNEATFLTIVVNKATVTKLRILTDLFHQTLRETLLSLGVNVALVAVLHPQHL